MGEFTMMLHNYANSHHVQPSLKYFKSKKDYTSTELRRLIKVLSSKKSKESIHLLKYIVSLNFKERRLPDGITEQQLCKRLLPVIREFVQIITETSCTQSFESVFPSLKQILLTISQSVKHVNVAVWDELHHIYEKCLFLDRTSILLMAVLENEHLGRKIAQDLHSCGFGQYLFSAESKLNVQVKLRFLRYNNLLCACVDSIDEELMKHADSESLIGLLSVSNRSQPLDDNDFAFAIGAFSAINSSTEVCSMVAKHIGFRLKTDFAVNNSKPWIRSVMSLMRKTQGICSISEYVFDHTCPCIKAYELNWETIIHKLTQTSLNHSTEEIFLDQLLEGFLLSKFCFQPTEDHTLKVYELLSIHIENSVLNLADPSSLERAWSILNYIEISYTPEKLYVSEKTLHKYAYETLGISNFLVALTFSKKRVAEAVHQNLDWDYSSCDSDAIKSSWWYCKARLSSKCSIVETNLFNALHSYSNHEKRAAAYYAMKMTSENHGLEYMALCALESLDSSDPLRLAASAHNGWGKWVARRVQRDGIFSPAKSEWELCKSSGLIILNY